MRLTDFKILTFDCYGTLIDWKPALVNALRPLFGSDLVRRSRNDILAAFARHETAPEAETPEMIYPSSSLCNRRLAEEWGSPRVRADHRAFGASSQLAAFSRLGWQHSPISSTSTSSSSCRMSTAPASRRAGSARRRL